MKIRKFLTGMTAGIMAVSSAIVCQISAGAVDVTLVSGTAVASWKDITVDISKAGTATEDSSLEISCPAPDGAVENQRLFNVILNDADWDSPTYSASYDSSKTEFSVTVPGSALTGKSNVMIQAGDIGVNVTVKAVGFAEDARATADITLDLPTNLRMDVYTDDSTIGANAGYEVDVTDQFSVKTYGDLLDAFKGADLPAGKYVGDSLDLGADGFEMSIGFMGSDGSGSEYWGSTDTVSYKDGGFLAIDSDSYYPGSRDDTICEINVTIRPKMEYIESEGKNQAVSEKVRNLREGDAIVIQTAEDAREAFAAPELPTNVKLTAYQDSTWLSGSYGAKWIELTDMLNAETVGDLSKNYKSITIPAGKYISDTLGLGADGFEYCLEFNATDSNNEIHYGGIGYSISYTNGGSFLLDDMNYDGSGSDKLNFISLNLRTKVEDAGNGKSQAVSEKVRNLREGDTIVIQTAEDARSEVTVPAPTGAIVMSCYRDEWNEGTMACADIPASSVSGITSGKTTVKELKEKYKTISASGKPVYTKDSLNLGKDAFTYAVWLHMKNGSQEDWWRGTLVSFDETAVLNTEDIDSSLDDYAIEEIGFTVYPVIEELPNGKNRAVNEKIRSLDPDKTEKIYINGTEAADDDEDDIKYDGMGEVKEKGTKVFGNAEWDPEQLDITIAAIDPSWLKTEDDIIIFKMKYNKDYYEEWARLVIAKNDGDYSEGFAYQFGERDFNIHIRVGELMKYWNCSTVKELAGKNMMIQLWEPNEGDSVDYQISIISPKFEEKIEAPADKSEDYVPPAIELVPDKTASQTTGVKPSVKNPSEKVYDTRFVMSVSSSDLVSGEGFKMVAYITIKRLDTNQTATVSTTICYDSVSAVGDTISAADGQKLLAFAIVNIPAGVDIEYTSIIMGVADV